MLKPIKCDCYEEETYESLKKYYCTHFEHHKSFDSSKVAKCVTTWSVVSAIFRFFTDELDECGMDRFVLLLSGMLWAIENGGITEDDPDNLAYNAWFTLNEFKSGEFDDLFTPEDLMLIKKDLEMVFAYYDEHPVLKG